MNSKLGKVLRVIAIVFMGLSAAMNIFSGAGTTCAAFLTKDFPPYWVLITSGVQWLFQTFVVLTLLIGILGIWAVIQLVRGQKNAYRNALILLILGTIVNGVHVYASNQYLDNIMPIAVTFILNLFTLIYFLILKIPGLKEKVDFSKANDANDRELASGVTAVVVGIVALAMPLWAGPSHMFEGGNYLDDGMQYVIFAGVALTLGGALLILHVIINLFAQEVSAQKTRVHEN